MPTEKESVAELKIAFDQIEAATTAAGTAAAAIQTRINDLMDQIIASDNMADINALAERAKVSAATLTPLAASLTAMGQSPSQPVPEPVPAPPAE